MANLLVFDYRSYKKYLETQLDKRSVDIKGQRFKLSKQLRCQPAYLSQVLNGSANLSLEQADGVNKFLGHSDLESKFFLYLVHLERAGTKSLQDFYQAEIDAIIKQRLQLSHRLEPTKTFSDNVQAIYYSSWFYTAIDVLTSIPQFSSRERIAAALNLPLKTVSEVLDFLLRVNLIKQERNRFVPTERSIHLGKSSPFLVKHHLNWKVRALQSLDDGHTDDFHYTSVVTCSKSDVPAINEILIAAIEKIREVVKHSKDETSIAYMIDLINLIK